MKHRLAQSTLAVTLAVSMTAGLVMNAMVFDYAYAQQTSGSGNGNSTATNGNSGNSNGNGASTSAGNQGNGNNGNNGNHGNGNNGNGNGNQGQGNGPKEKRTGADGGGGDSYYNGNGDFKRAGRNFAPGLNKGENGSETVREPAPFEKALARWFRAPQKPAEQAEEKTVDVAPVRTAAVKRVPRSKLLRLGRDRVRVSVRPPAIVARPSDVDPDAPTGEFGQFANTTAVMPPEETVVQPEDVLAVIPSLVDPIDNTPTNDFAASQPEVISEVDTLTLETPQLPIGAMPVPDAVSPQGETATVTSQNAAGAGVDPNLSPRASVSMRPAKPLGKRIAPSSSSLASSLLALSKGGNADALGGAPQGSVPGMLNSYRQAALLEAQKKSAYDAAVTARLRVTAEAMKAEHALIAVLEDLEKAKTTTEKALAEEALAVTRDAMTKAALALEEVKQAEVDAALALEQAQVVKFHAFSSMPGANELPGAAREELNALLGVQRIVASTPRQAPVKVRLRPASDDDV